VRFRAAILHETGQPLAIDDVTLRALGPHDVLVRLRASGLCHTDLEVIQGALPYPLPIVLGHEGAGLVEAVGAEVTLVRLGDHVVCSWNPHCGRCFYCERDEPILCEVFTRTQPRGQLLDGTSRLSLAGGGALHHFSAVSSHAECCVVHESSAIPVPTDIPFDRACLLGCGVMTGVGAATRVARVMPGASALVVGVGAVGLNVVQGARLAGADVIVAVDVDDGKLALARTLGATHVVNALREEPLARVREATGGRGADYAFEAGGREATFQLTVEAARPGATVVLLGKVAVNERVSFRWGSLMGDKRIVRSSYGGARPRRDFPWLARAYLDGRLRLDELITRRLALEDVNDGFASMVKGNVVRAVLIVNERGEL
jgi:S-(hydroxymethyl)glutathione dehydrogenase / alcohol dehydrogenase